MSTKVKGTEHKSNGQLENPVAIPDLEPPPSGTSRFRRGNVVAAVTVAIALVIAAVVGTNLLARQYTPDGAVRQYLAALQSGDANAAWNEVQVSAASTSVSNSLIDQGSLRAALGRAKPDIRSFDITGTQNTDSSTAVVAFSYSTAAGSKQANLAVQRSGQTRFALYPVWLITLQPTLLQFVLPQGVGTVDVDGRRLALPAGTSSVAVWPVAHKVDFEGSNLFAPATLTLDSFGLLGQTVPYTPQLTPDGLAKVQAAVKTGFDACSRQTSANPAGLTPCPQTISYSSTDTGKWTVVGDPTSDMVVSFGRDMSATAEGHFQMVFAYTEEGFATARHEPASGGYAANLSLTSAAVTVADLKAATGLPALNRPAPATDQAIESMVSSAFAKCAAARLEFVADCPQQIGAAGATKVRWKLSGDPLSGASVTFDSVTGLITVHGNFQMSASYLWLGNSDSASSFVTAYNAYIFWDGQALQLVTIDGSTS